MLSRQGVHTLAAGYLIGAFLGFLTYAAMLRQLFRERGIHVRATLRRIVFPVREVFSFSTPLLTSDVVNVLKSSFVVVLLEYFATTTQVAEFRAVVPVAGLNLVVMQSFKYLFTPEAARLFARNDSQGINDLYWRSATWIAIITFPVFAASFSLARPLTVLLFEERYASSATVLALLALGNYMNAAMGFNAYTLRVFGKVRFIVAIDLFSALAGVVLNVLLIPRYGAIGAAIGTTAALVLYNLLNHAGLLLGTQIHLFQPRYLRVYASIVLGAALLLLIDQLLNPGIVAGSLLIAAISLLLVAVNWQVMEAGRMFPELRRIPVLGPRLVALEKR
jgi:O-antigen/teichoic acid export membrane protein